MNSWLKLYRQIADNELWLSERFTKSQAWIDILILANYTKKTVFLKGAEFVMNPGMLCWSIKALASRWKWNERTVEKFLSWLENREMIQSKKTNITTVITVCNWNKYQANTARNAEQIQRGIHTDIEGKEGKEKDIVEPHFFACEFFTVSISDSSKYAEGFRLKQETMKREFLKMAGWLTDNPNRRKKKYRTFISNWLGKVTPDAPVIATAVGLTPEQNSKLAELREQGLA